MNEKQCIKCNEVKTLECFGQNYKGNYSSVCKTCTLARVKAWNKNHPQKTKAANLKYQLKSRYNISVHDYNKLLNFQNGKCAICEKHYTEFKRRLAVNHARGQVRGLLCASCGSTLKKLMDDNIILKITNYIQMWSK